MMKPKILIRSLVLIFSICFLQADEQKVTKVLYVDHEPGNYHKAIPQKKKFMEMAEKQGWSVTNLTGSDKEVIAKLGTGDFAKGYDVVVYNICVANTEDLKAPANIIRQTKELGVPAFLIHGSLHCFWPTYKSGQVTPKGFHKKVKAKEALVNQWKNEHADKAFPAWSTFTGIASHKHGPRKPIIVKSLNNEHPILEGFTEFSTGDTSELYNNAITQKDSPESVVILEGHQKINDKRTDKAVILWEHPLPKAKVVCFTLGHDMSEWEQPEVLQLIANSVNCLAKDGKIESQ